MIEPEIAFADLERRHGSGRGAWSSTSSAMCWRRRREEIDFLNQFVDKGLKERLEHVA